jgi:uncharacterized membrane protein YiaA
LGGLKPHWHHPDTVSYSHSTGTYSAINAIVSHATQFAAQGSAIHWTGLSEQTVSGAQQMNRIQQQPSSAFIAAAWVALFVGFLAFLIGLWNASMLLNEKGYYLTVLLYGLFSAVSLQKSVRDQLEDIPVTAIYFGLCWASVIIAIVLLVVGLWNATLTLSEKGFYGMAFVLSLFAAITVQKNTRDSSMSAPIRTIQKNPPEATVGDPSA